jgi:hypothetical protein
MVRCFGFLAWVALTCAVLQGCGGGADTGLNTGPATDNRTAEEKQSDELLQKSRADYNKKFRR